MISLATMAHGTLAVSSMVLPAAYFRNVCYVSLWRLLGILLFCPCSYIFANSSKPRPLGIGVYVWCRLLRPGVVFNRQVACTMTDFLLYCRDQFSKFACTFLCRFVGQWHSHSDSHIKRGIADFILMHGRLCPFQDNVVYTSTCDVQWTGFSLLF